MIPGYRGMNSIVLMDWILFTITTSSDILLVRIQRIF